MDEMKIQHATEDWKARAEAAERERDELRAALERAIDLIPRYGCQCPDQYLARKHAYDGEYIPQAKCLDCWFHYDIKDPQIVGKALKDPRDCWREYVVNYPIAKTGGLQ